MKRIYLIILCLSVSGLRQTYAQSHTDTAKNNQSYITNSIKIDGLVTRPLDLTVADLQKMKIVEIKNYDVIGKGGAVKSHYNSFKGVLLRDILTDASIDAKSLKESGALYIVATAADQFKAVFSWAEIFNNSIGDHVMVVFEEDGKPIVSTGKMVLFNVTDKINGMRHIKWLKEITVRKAD